MVLSEGERLEIEKRIKEKMAQYMESQEEKKIEEKTEENSQIWINKMKKRLEDKEKENVGNKKSSIKKTSQKIAEEETEGTDREDNEKNLSKEIMALKEINSQLTMKVAEMEKEIGVIREIESTLRGDDKEELFKKLSEILEILRGGGAPIDGLISELNFLRERLEELERERNFLMNQIESLTKSVQTLTELLKKEKIEEKHPSDKEQDVRQLVEVVVADTPGERDKNNIEYGDTGKEKSESGRKERLKKEEVQKQREGKVLEVFDRENRENEEGATEEESVKVQTDVEQEETVEHTPPEPEGTKLEKTKNKKKKKWWMLWR